MAQCGEMKIRMFVQMDNEFAVGEIVELKSGGPPMTVVDACEDCDTVTTARFNYDENMGEVVEYDHFPAAALQPYVEDDE